MGLLEKFRQWLDADYQEERGVEAQPRNKSEEFLVKVARAVEKEMRDQMFTPPGGPTYIPRDYIVFLSAEDDAEWRGEKRRGLEQGLFHVLSEQAALIAGEKQLQTSSFAVELRVDGTLEKGNFRVQAVWDTESEKTIVQSRKSKPALPAAEEPEDEATLVRPRALFSVLVSRASDGVPRTMNFTQPAITIGRGSRKMKVDLELPEDMEVSRHHATIEYQKGVFKITCEGRNPILVDGAELGEGASTVITPGQRVEICSYTLEVAPAR